MISGTWLGSRFLARQRQEVHRTSVTLPGVIAYMKSDMYIVPDLPAGETVHPEHLLCLGLCSSLTPSLPSL